MSWLDLGIILSLLYMSVQDWKRQEVDVWVLWLLGFLVSYDVVTGKKLPAATMLFAACLVVLSLLFIKRGIERRLQYSLLGEGDIILLLLLAFHLPGHQLPFFCIYSGMLGFITAYGHKAYGKSFPLVPSLTGSYVICRYLN